MNVLDLRGRKTVKRVRLYDWFVFVGGMLSFSSVVAVVFLFQIALS